MRPNDAIDSLGPVERGADQGLGGHRLECRLLTEQVKVVARRHVHQAAPPARVDDYHAVGVRNRQRA